MRIEVDATRCMGHAVCEAIRPDLFETDEEGISHWIAGSSMPFDEHGELDQIIGQCPVGALSVRR